MELLNYFLLTVAVYLIIAKPEKEKLIFRILGVCFALNVFVYVVLGGPVLPYGNL